MSIITTAAFAKAFLPGVNEWVGMSYNEVPPEWPVLFKKETTQRAFEEDVMTTGLGLATVKEEGGGITYGTMSQSFISRYTPVRVGLGFIITYEAIVNNLYEQLGRARSSALGFSLRVTKEYFASNVFNRAFNSSYVGGDGVELCATTHPNKAGGTWANELSTAADLSELAIEQALIDIQGFTNDAGLPIGISGVSLHVHRNDQFEATRILRSEKQNDTANNATNALMTTNSLPGGIFTHRYFSDSDAWFIKTDCPNGLKMFEREPMKTDASDSDFDTENAKFKAIDWYVFYWTDPRGVFGSPGA